MNSSSMIIKGLKANKVNFTLPNQQDLETNRSMFDSARTGKGNEDGKTKGKGGGEQLESFSDKDSSHAKLNKRGSQDSFKDVPKHAKVTVHSPDKKK